MKKGAYKFDEKFTKKASDPLKGNPAPAHFPINNQSATHLRPHLARQADSPSKVGLPQRGTRKPEFFRNKAEVTQQEEKKNMDERRSYKDVYPNRDTFIGSEGKGKQTQIRLKTSKGKQLRETVKSDGSQYQRLNEKLNAIQAKIDEMSKNIDIKREQKRIFMQEQKKERQKRFQKYQKPQQNKLKQSLQKFVTQVNEGKDYVSSNFNPYSPRHNTYYVSEIVKFYKDERSLARQHVTMSAQYLRIFQNIKAPTQQQVQPKLLKLAKKPSHADKKTVVFDLDETLIHCNDSLELPHDVKLKIKFPTGQEIEAGINIRPHAVEILKALSRNFEVIVFTASHSCYANVVLDYLDPQGEYVHHRLYREHCYVTPESVYVKDLRIINRDPSQLILVDNAAYSYAFQLDNAIPILPYYKGRNDFQLRALQSYIESMLFAKDVRDTNRKTFKLHRYRQYDNIDSLVKQLYGQFN